MITFKTDEGSLVFLIKEKICSICFNFVNEDDEIDFAGKDVYNAIEVHTNGEVYHYKVFPEEAKRVLGIVLEGF